MPRFLSFCRFISPDAVEYLGANGDLTSYNLYAYCSNNPVMFRDDSGHVSQAAIIAGGIIGGAIVGGLMGAFTALSTDGDVAEASIAVWLITSVWITVADVIADNIQ